MTHPGPTPDGDTTGRHLRSIPDTGTNTTGLDRIPPQDIDAEQSLLGGMLFSKDAIADTTEVLHSPADFHRPAHETIYRAICDLYQAGEPADPITIAAHLRKTGNLDRCGGVPYLHTLTTGVPAVANAGYYAEIVRDKAQLRRLVEAGLRITEMGYAAAGDTAEILDAAGAEFNAAVSVREDSEAAFIGDDIGDFLDELDTLARDGRAMGVPTGFTDLDHLTNGLHSGQLVIVAGRPAMGKSTLGVDMARHAAIKRGRPVVFFSLEMGRREIQQRVTSAEARVGLHNLRSGNLTNADWTRIAEATPGITGAPLTIDATPGQTVMSIKAKCRRLQQRGGLDLAVIDYLQLLTSGASRRMENRQVEVSEMSRNLKLMAKELGIPVVVLAQLNRGPEQRTDKKPAMSDLRESGSLEQDADVVILLHRPDAYDKESQRAGEVDLIVDKHRNGPTATITVAGQLHYSRFVDMAAGVPS